MKTYYIALCTILLFLFSCEKPKEINLQSLNGYWEIEKAIAPNGEEKAYQFNSFIDFITIKSDSTGYRSKLKPNFAGTYEGNKVKQRFTIVYKSGTYYINYNVNNNTWNETLVEATSNKFITKNNEGVLYIYKPFIPISVE